MTLDSSVHACPQCGRSILADAEFCPHCGARSGRPRRSVFLVLLDWLVMVVAVLLALVFGLAGACFLLIGTGGGFSGRGGGTLLGIVMIAVGIALLLAAGALIRYLRRRRGARK